MEEFRLLHIQYIFNIVLIDVGLCSIDDLHAVADLYDAVGRSLRFPVRVGHDKSLVLHLDSQAGKACVHIQDIVCAAEPFDDGGQNVVADLFAAQFLDLCVVLFAARRFEIKFLDQEPEAYIVL